MQPTCPDGAKQYHLLCLHCNKNETLGQVIAGCETSLREKRYNYRRNSTLLNLGKILEFIKSVDIHRHSRV